MSQPPPRLRSIYLLDLLEFTKRRQIEEWRVVSRRYNHVICSAKESRLPKRKFQLIVNDSVSSLRLICPASV